MPCRRCTVCECMSHHWLEEIEDADPHTYTHACKHCEAVGMLCDDCDAGLRDDDETLCPTCQGESVIYVRDIPGCDWCDDRVPVQTGEVIGLDGKLFCYEDCREQYADEQFRKALGRAPY
jgi:hypothetical protein